MAMTRVARIALPPVAKRRTGRVTEGPASARPAGRGYFGEMPVFIQTSDAFNAPGLVPSYRKICGTGFQKPEK